MEAKDVTLLVKASSILLLDNGTDIGHNAASLLLSGSATINFASSIVISGRFSLFLPEYIVLVNISRNYTRIRVMLQATVAKGTDSSAEYPKFVFGEESYIDIVPKCAMGSYIDSVGATYDCIKCPNATYSNLADSRTCRSEPFFVFFLLKLFPCSR